MSGAHFALSPSLGALATPAPWQLIQTCLYVASPDWAKAAPENSKAPKVMNGTNFFKLISIYSCQSDCDCDCDYLARSM
jgi:hypothetical protein